MSRLLKKYRTYFDKNNTIISNSLVNTANNPVSELTYGDSCSRFLFFSDFTELKNKHINGELDPAITTHKLYLKNTSNYDVSQSLFENSLTYDGKLRAYSVDLELHLIDEFWDAGVGYDFNQTIFDKPDERSYVKGPSNWIYRTTTDQWTTPGAISGGSQAIATFHLENGGEDLVFDISSIVNSIIVDEYSDNTFHGFAIKYPETIELNSSGGTSYLGLFSKYTQSYFEPYIETTQLLEIFDDRRNFTKDKDNYLYFYSMIGGQLTDLDELPTVNIDNAPSGYTYNVERATKGIYRVLITPDLALTPNVMYYDVWDNLKYNAKSLAPVTLDFVPKSSEYYFDLGLINTEEEMYGISLSGIKMEEKIKGGEVRTVRALIRKPLTPDFISYSYDIYYTLYIKQGPNRVTVIDWEKLDFLYSGYEFTIDTTWLIPQQYFVDIRVVTNNNVKILNEEIKFNVINDFTNKTKQ